MKKEIENIKKEKLNQKKFEVEKQIKSMYAIANDKIIKNAVRGVTRDIIVSGDRGTGKTTTALVIAHQRLVLKEKFIFVVLNDNMKQDVTGWFISMGYRVEKNQVLDTFNNDELIGFIASINTADKEKLKGYRNFNITTMIIDEVVSETGKVDFNIGKKMSSLISSVFGQWKLEKWKFYNLMILILTNNINSNHPIFYLYGLPDEKIGVTFKYNKKVCLISLVNNDSDEKIDPLLTLGGYDKIAYGRKLVLDETILIQQDFTLDGWEHLFNFELYEEFGAIYIKENELLMHNEILNNEPFICIGTNDKTKNINYQFLSNIKKFVINDRIKYSDWKIKQLLITTIQKNIVKI